MNRAEANKLLHDLDAAQKNLMHGYAHLSGVLEGCIEIMLDENYSRQYAEKVTIEFIKERIAKWSATPPEPGSYNALFNTQNHDNATAPVPPITDLAANTVIPVSDRQ